MLFDEAKKHKESEFNQVQKNIDDLIVECDDIYRSLLKYNDLITYEELYELTDADKENFIKIRIGLMRWNIACCIIRKI